MTDQNTFCAIGCRCSCVACFQWELHYYTCHSRLAGPARCDVVIFGSAVAADGAHVSVLPKNDTGSWLRWRAWVGVEQGDAAAVGVAGVALGDIHLRFTWHAWYLVASTGHVPLLPHLHFCVHCDMFVLDEIVVPASSVAI